MVANNFLTEKRQDKSWYNHACLIWTNKDILNFGGNKKCSLNQSETIESAEIHNEEKWFGEFGTQMIYWIWKE